MSDAENKPSAGEQPPEDKGISAEGASSAPSPEDAPSSSPVVPAPRKTIQGLGALRTASGAGLSLSERLKKLSAPGASADVSAEKDPASIDQGSLEARADAIAEDDAPTTIEMLPEDLDEGDDGNALNAGGIATDANAEARASAPRATMLSHAIGPIGISPADASDSADIQTSAPNLDEVSKPAATHASSLAEPTPPEAPDDLTVEEAFVGEATEIAPGLSDAPPDDDLLAERTEIAPGLMDAAPEDLLAERTEIAPGLGEHTRDDLQPERTEIARSVFDTASEAPPPVDRSSVSMELVAAADSGAFEATQISSVEELARGDRSRAGTDVAAKSPAPASDDFAAQATEVFSSPFEADPVCPRISTLSGPTVGQEFLVNRIRSTVGRGTDNSIVVPDLSMSRKHFEIIQQHDDSLMVRDLMSINGTALNGAKIREADLFHGDRIEAGQTTFQFVIPGDRPTESRQRRLIPAASTQTATALKQGQLGAVPSPASPRRLDRILMGVTIGAALLCLPLIGLIVHLALSPDEAKGAPATATAVHDSDARALYLEGVEAIKSREWERAEDLFKQAAAADSEFGEVDAQLARIATERRARATVERARARVDAIDKALLSELGAISRESVYHSEAQSLIRLARQGEVHGIFERAQRAFEAEDWAASREVIDDLLSISPQHEGGQRLLADLEAVEARQLEERQAEEARQREVASSTRRPSARPSTEREKPELDNPFADLGSAGAPSSSSGSRASSGSSGGSINFTEGFNLYRDENFDGAIAHFESIQQASGGAIGERAGRTAADVRTFRQSLQQGQQALDSGDFDRALTLIQRARKADESIAGGRGYFEQKTSTAMAHALAGQGLAALASDSYARAYSLLTRAQALSRSEPTTRRLALALEDEANSLYILAAGQRASDPAAAAELCRTILTMVPPSSDNHRRARLMLDELP
ncbi:FHA domain-containing protein [Lujinxingia vulgaris]|uniref:FHA domain-containing protein n=1 Tax=Lujinxingia vulgaris TaxID=2600176 RepID=A0A5C6XD00_9DELT|nr:FHA domain-containing protein [Lujinxingia vulgaris]TXD35981.1 FHA domain-containing protein [Lujinxingia vulgaris]